ncbi:MAG TPA: PEP-CTERM sorting domain-containing protein [Rhodanobacteraceae bacterium]|nr:PEP-CTERM sorting domain-containing protein [Rhodanobacteraceae bacterium]
MNLIKSLALVGVAATTLFSVQALATPCPTGMQGSPTCIATTNSYGEPALEDILGAAGTSGTIFSSGDGINPYTEQVSPASYWSVAGTGSSENKVVLTLTGSADNLTFGIFDPSNTSNRLMLFDGGDAGYRTSLATDGTGGFGATYYASTDPLSGPTGHTTTFFGAGNLFGYYLTNGNTTFYSSWMLNGDGTSRVVTYAGDGKNRVALTNGLFSPGEFLLAWEDGSDFDYNDFVVLVESVHPVPEPAALGMFGAGILLIGLFAGLRRRSRQV